MNPTLFVAEAPPAQSLPAETAAAVQPIDLAGGQPFAKLMEGTATDNPAEPVPRKNEQTGDDAAKKNDAMLATMMNLPVPAPVVLPLLPVLVCGQPSTMAKAEAPATSAAILPSQTSAPPVHEAAPTASVAVIGPAISNETAQAESPKILPPAAPAPAARVSTDASSESGKMPVDSRPTAVENVVEQQAPPPLDGEDRLVLPAAQIKPDQLGAPDGTVIAKEDSRMKRDVKVDKNSAPAEKILPRGNFSTSTKAASTRFSRNREAVSEATTEPAESSRESLVPREKPTTIYGTTVAEFRHFDVRVSTDGMSEDSVRAPQAEKVFNGISEQVVAFKKVGVDSMDAVLRPDRGTEISLHLSLGNNGQVDVVARVERGNFEGLQAHWSELQSSLAQQGVRVGELHQSLLNNDQAPSHHSSPQLGGAMGEQQQTQQQASRSRDRLDERPLVSSAAESPKGRTSTTNPAPSRRWEKWA